MCAFGREPPSELPPRSRVRKSSSSSSSRSRCSAAFSSLGSSSSGGTPVRSSREVGVAGCGIAETQSALTEIVAHAEQEIDLAKATFSAATTIDAPTLGTRDQPASPAVGCAIRESPEHPSSHRRLPRTGVEVERGVQLVGVGYGRGSRGRKRTSPTLCRDGGVTRADRRARPRLRSARRSRRSTQPFRPVMFLGRTRCGRRSSERRRPMSVS